MSEPLLPREVRRRLAIIQHAEEVTGNVAMTCRYYGISRQVYYRWLRRYQEQGVDGLRDLSRRPHRRRRPPRASGRYRNRGARVKPLCRKSTGLGETSPTTTAPLRASYRLSRWGNSTAFVCTADPAERTQDEQSTEPTVNGREHVPARHDQLALGTLAAVRGGSEHDG